MSTFSTQVRPSRRPKVREHGKRSEQDTATGLKSPLKYWLHEEMSRATLVGL